MGSSLPLVAKCIHLFNFGFLGLAACSARGRCSGKSRRMNEMEGSTLNGLSGDACHDAVVITVQKTSLKTTGPGLEELAVWVCGGCVCSSLVR